MHSEVMQRLGAKNMAASYIIELQLSEVNIYEPTQEAIGWAKDSK